METQKRTAGNTGRDGGNGETTELLMEKITEKTQGLEILEKAIEISSVCMALSSQLRESHDNSYGEKLKRCALNVYENIAQSIDAYSETDLFSFLSLAKKNLLEAAHILLILNKSQLISSSDTVNLFNELSLLNQEISQFEKSQCN